MGSGSGQKAVGRIARRRPTVVDIGLPLRMPTGQGFTGGFGLFVPRLVCLLLTPHCPLPTAHRLKEFPNLPIRKGSACSAGPQLSPAPRGQAADLQNGSALHRLPTRQGDGE